MLQSINKKDKTKESIAPQADTQDTCAVRARTHPDTFDAVYPTMNPGSWDEWGSHASPKKCRAQPPPLGIHTHTMTHHRWPHSVTQTHTGASEYNSETHIQWKGTRTHFKKHAELLKKLIIIQSTYGHDVSGCEVSPKDVFRPSSCVRSLA